MTATTERLEAAWNEDPGLAPWLSTVDHSVPGLAAAQGALFDRLATVRPSSWSYQLLSPDVQLTPAQLETIRKLAKEIAQEPVPREAAKASIDFRRTLSALRRFMAAL